MGRPKGSTNRTPAAHRFVSRVEAMIKAADPECDSLARVGARLLLHGDAKTQTQVFRTLLQYKLGMPTQPIEHSGEVSYTERVHRMRERAKGHGL